MNRLLFPALLTLATATAEVTFVDDARLLSTLQKNLGTFSEREGIPSASELSASLEKVPRHLCPDLDLQLVDQSPKDPAKSVFLIGSVYKCGKCDKWHSSGVATAWALTRDGLMVTNHHVFKGKEKSGAFGVIDRKGRAYPVTAIVAANPDADVAVFRVDAANLVPLALGTEPRVGAPIRVISHPQRRFFTETFGHVSRYFRRPGREDRGESVWMTITADYARGSSGGPVLNRRNQVVGMVSFTQSIYYESDNNTPKGPLQMVIKNAVPVRAMKDVLTPAAAATDPQAEVTEGAASEP